MGGPVSGSWVLETRLEFKVKCRLYEIGVKAFLWKRYCSRDLNEIRYRPR